MNNEFAIWRVLNDAAIAAFAAFISAFLILALRPLLQRYALARPNARSSHMIPTPQGGGIAVVAATIIATYHAYLLSGSGLSATTSLLSVFTAVVLIACVGAVDDVRSMGVVPRLLLQALAIWLVVRAQPDALRVTPFLPWWIERTLLVFGGLWFVNLVNFMDGLDWMTVAEVVPITATLAILGGFGALPHQEMIVTVALCGAMIGFAYFNRPIAKIFLGDVGSLPIGLLLGWLLLVLAGEGHLVAAIILPLYYLADATITLLRRLVRGEPIWLAHRAHFYQRATERGLTVTEVVARVFAVNLGLCALAVVTVVFPSILIDIAALFGAAMLVGWVLVSFVQGKK